MQSHEQFQLLQTAADVVRAVVVGEPRPFPNEAALAGPACGGAFVTLRTAGRLRGCVGTFEMSRPLPAVVAEMTEASLEDSRFERDRLEADELPLLHIEISVIGPKQRTTNPLSLQVGIHGVHMRYGGRTGCFLPKVAVEAGWDAQTLLDQLCDMKMGLPRRAWRESDAEISLFTTETFGAAWAELQVPRSGHK